MKRPAAADEGAAASQRARRALEQVLPERRLPPLERVAFLAARTPVPATNRLLLVLMRTLPLAEGFGHLKRVRRPPGATEAEILLVPERAREELERCGEAKAAMEAAECGVAVVEVPRFRPMAAEQLAEWRAVWPVQPKLPPPEETVREVPIAAGEMPQLERWMELAAEQAQQGGGCAGAVIVDAETGEVVAAAHDAPAEEHPLKNAVMRCIDAVGEHNQAVCAKQTSKSARPYLCTGLDLFVTVEPCIMTAMALVHSRIRRVFYRDSHPQGALGSLRILHADPRINHHYPVYRGL